MDWPHLQEPIKSDIPKPWRMIILPTLSGILEKKNDHRSRFLHSSLNLSKSNNSPIGIPHPARSHSWSQKSVFWQGHASKLGWSPTTAEKFSSHSHRRVSSQDSTPTAGGVWRSANALHWSSDSFSYARTQPVRIKRISPFWNLVPWLAAICLRMDTGIEVVLKEVNLMPCSSAQEA